ncbi:hypothetical protein TELCIR_09378 [Teladorsagia circumcincta]|uniref:Uncharacterized protein n=1 Tax=Teladorsagia circumcincta TaxID=45464 RepID=A0A2G9UF07_TELCI|nr:hypothetical protein TELCIR_09378 [Teladorsagia circumcincta]
MIIVVCIKEWKYNHIQRTFYMLIISQIINTSHRWILPTMQWSVPVIYSIPLLVASGATFKAPEDLEIVVAKEKITGIVDIVVMMNYFLFWTLRVGQLFDKFYWEYQDYYVATWAFNQTYISVFIRAVKQERRLYIQMLGLFFGFVLLLIYNIMHLKYSLSSNDGPIFTMRIVFPMISCFSSYINAWMMLFLNGDIRVKILILVGLREQKLQSSLKMSTSLKDGPIFTMRIVFPMISCFFSYINAWMMLILNNDIRGKILVLFGIREQKLQSA